ncbi:hypothetical protein [Chryseobacterium sp. MFBS3-17]|uniref:hypothetical protein n=1 Tax=Chryseobacterium sp. MFBS3-17 TaxID=2886689 RepID=UPI001D0F048B|nr:hypothetical protein [Chryseobacterium sp. MFBS3-17]MCC2590049.1 hypothetical protein [Chryseobacterium sp. MFBS3-17]
MVSINTHKVAAIFLKYQQEIDQYHKNAYKKLLQFKKTNRLKNSANKFLVKIIFQFSNRNFFTVDNREYDNLVKEIGAVPKLKKKFYGKQKQTYLKDEILNILNYKARRGDFFPKCFQILEIKSCVYCNSQLTISVEKEDSGISAKFQLDHYYPKDQYPYLSVALLNLYPVCAACNLSKSNNIVNFILYDDNFSNNFKFEIDKKTLSDFILDRKTDVIVNFKGDELFEKQFNINAIYKTQSDITEELITKSLIYSASYRRKLIENFSINKINDSLINRFILGNYSEPNEVHKRPMAKFMQDIGRDIGLV